MFYRKLMKEFALELLLGLCSLLVIVQFFLLTAGFWSGVHWLRVGADCLAAVVLFLGARTLQPRLKRFKKRKRLHLREHRDVTYRYSCHAKPPIVVEESTESTSGGQSSGSADPPEEKPEPKAEEQEGPLSRLKSLWIVADGEYLATQAEPVYNTWKGSDVGGYQDGDVQAAFLKRFPKRLPEIPFDTIGFDPDQQKECWIEREERQNALVVGCLTQHQEPVSQFIGRLLNDMGSELAYVPCGFAGDALGRSWAFYRIGSREITCQHPFEIMDGKEVKKAKKAAAA